MEIIDNILRQLAFAHLFKYMLEKRKTVGVLGA